ncbi:MAG: leucine-rich repeat domain-containing protein [Clostridiales bacterium]|nr:leucine-rich repeat domain-containing protein [Clostridiales bacterium]
MKKSMMFLVFCAIGLMVFLSSCSTNTNVTPVATTETASETSVMSTTTTETMSDTNEHIHSFGEWVTTKEPTCTETGEKERYCSCGEKQTQTIAAQGHSFGAWNTIKKATCTEEGVQERVCSCGAKETSAIPMIDHHYVNYVCDVCGKVNASEGLEYSLKNNTYIVTGRGSCNDSTLVIPNEHNGKPVTAIGKDAFRGNSFVNLFIPDSITSIEYGAFSHSWNLKSVTIPASVTHLGDYIFDFCQKLEKATFMGSVDSFGQGMFYGCKALKEITLPSGITTIGDSAFLFCERLTSVTIPEGVQFIDSFAFCDCKNLSTIKFPSSLIKIDGYAFNGCNKLNTIWFQGNRSQWSKIAIDSDGNSPLIKANIKFN